MTEFKTKFYWHIHHKVLVEALTEPIENRIKFIKEHKPEHERELRLRLLKPVTGNLPNDVIEARKALVKARKALDKAGEALDKAGTAYDKALEALDKAGEAYVKAWTAYVKASEAYNKALLEHREELKELHAKECPDCPWDGETIFPIVE